MEWLKVFFGYQYLVNLHSGEVHDLKNEHPNCRTYLISKDHKLYVKKAKAKRMMKTGSFNGCRWCMKKEDTDKW
jgi:hypothetical protein